MAQAYGFQTWPHIFTPAVCLQLAAVLDGFSNDRVFASTYDDDFHIEFPVADRFITVFSPNFPVEQASVSGGGLINTGFDSLMLTTAFVRLEADPEGRSTQLLQEEAFGVYKLIQNLISCLQMWTGPIDATTSMAHFRRPMRLAPGWKVDRRKAKSGGRWAVVPVSWEVSFVGDLGEPYPA